MKNLSWEKCAVCVHFVLCDKEIFDKAMLVTCSVRNGKVCHFRWSITSLLIIKSNDQIHMTFGNDIPDAQMMNPIDLNDLPDFSSASGQCYYETCICGFV